MDAKPVKVIRWECSACGTQYWEEEEAEDCCYDEDEEGE